MSASKPGSSFRYWRIRAAERRASWRRIAALRARKDAGKLSGPMEPTKAQSQAERERNRSTER
jgi:hypothetical protein